MASLTRIPHAFSRRFVWAGYLLGFSLGGFFDGILLHQILQWHHLLSLVQGVEDLRAQVLWDGLFHALMYVVAGVGLWMLYRGRREFTGVRADRNFLASLLVGFGAWHVLDAVLSHWLFGIHRIRVDVPNPLAWDLGWLVAFGLVPLAIGLAMKRRYPRTATLPDRRGLGRAGVAASIAALVFGAGFASLLPPRDAQAVPTTTVVLRPDVRAGEFLAGLEAKILWGDPAGGVWVLVDTQGPSLDLYRRGALYVSGSILPAGCSAWLRR